MFSRLHFHKEMCEMLSVPVPCLAAVLAAGWAQAGEEWLRARAGALAWDRRRLRLREDRAGSEGSRRAASPGLRPGGNL